MKTIEIKGDSNLNVLWLHGYGANAWDLLDLAELCDPEGFYNHYFANAPIDLYGQGERGPRAWFPLDLSLLGQIGPGGGGLKLSQQRREGALAAVPEIDALIEEHGFDEKNLVIGGFSQGAILSLHWMLEKKAHPRGIFLLSGAPVDEEYLQQKLPEHSGQRFFQSHGMNDEVLSYSEAEKLRSFFKKAEFKGKWIPFKGGHAVPQVVIEGLAQSLLEWRKD